MRHRLLSLFASGFTLFLCMAMVLFLSRFTKELCEESICPSFRVSVFFANYPELESVTTLYENGQWMEELTLKNDIPTASLPQLLLYTNGLETLYTYHDRILKFPASTKDENATAHFLWYGVELPPFSLSGPGLPLNELHFLGETGKNYSFLLKGAYPPSTVLSQKINDTWIPLESSNKEGSLSFERPIKEKTWIFQVSFDGRSSNPIEVNMNTEVDSKAPVIKTVDTDDSFLFGTTFTIQGRGLANVTVAHPRLTILSAKEDLVLLQIAKEASPGEILEFVLNSPYGESPMISLQVADVAGAVTIQEKDPSTNADFSSSSQEQSCDISATDMCVFWSF